MSFFRGFSKKLKVLKNSLEFFRTLIKNKNYKLIKGKQSHFAIEQISALLLISCILFAAEFGFFSSGASAETILPSLRTGEKLSKILNDNDKDIIEEKHDLKNPSLSFEKFETKGLIFANLVPLEKKEKISDPDPEPLIIVQKSALISLSNGKDPKDFSKRTEPFKYIVKAGDSPSTIADLFGITTNTILWANSLNYWQYINPGDELLILPVSGVQHKVNPGEDINSIAKKYKADAEEIIAFNMLSADGAIKSGQVLIIPGGKIQTPLKKKKSQTRLTSVFKARKNIYDYQNKRHHFPYGYCTYYVSSRYPIPWSGHAKSWLKNARAYGFSTGNVPKKGSIVVTTESWWGHVAIVESFSNTHITISEMNYKGWGKISIRKIPINSKIIRGYIYVK